MSLDTSPSLLIRLRNPDEAAWREFVDLYTPLLLQWSKRAGLRDDDATELIQEVLLTLINVLPTFNYDSGKSFRGWLSTVLRNRLTDLQRKNARHAANDIGLSGVPAADEFTELEEGEYRRYLVQRGIQLIEEELGPTTVAAFRATAIEDRPVAEVAASLGLSENAVYQARRRVMQKLKERLEGLW